MAKRRNGEIYEFALSTRREHHRIQGRSDLVQGKPDVDRGELCFNEINTLPGSMAFYLRSAAPHDWTITEVLSKLITRADRARATKHGLQRRS